MPPRSRRSSDSAGRRSVFVNCPFDPEYKPLLRSMCFTLLACGCVPRTALDEADSAVVRFEKILDLIVSCDASVHDVSRVELDAGSGLPRFNMPLELGADLALRLRGPAWHKRRRILVLDALPHRYDRTLSDISGMDIEAHGNQPAHVVRAIRDWLNSGRDQARPLPGSASIVADYAAFQELAGDLIAELRLDELDSLAHADFIYVVEAVLPMIEATRTAASHP